MTKLIPYGQTSLLPPAREQELVNACLEYLNLQHFCWRVNQGAVTAEHNGKKRFIRFNNIKGVSDILGILKPSGRLIAVECKKKPNKPTPDQLNFLELVNRHGGLGIVVYDLEALIEACST